MDQKLILLMMKCIQGKVECIDEQEFFWRQNVYGLDRIKLTDKYLENNPLFRAEYKPTTEWRWNRWYYVGSKS